jgi:hypothetical protein
MRRGCRPCPRACHEPHDDPSQAAKGATIIRVCAGAKVVANAGLLNGKQLGTRTPSDEACNQ